MATLTKAQLVERLVSKSVFRKGKSVRVVETLFELIRHSLEQGEDVLITGFGKFCVKAKDGRILRNPQTAEFMRLPPRTVVTFKCSDLLRGRMNQDDGAS